MSQSGALSISSGGGPVTETLTGNSGGPVGPDAGFNINVMGNNASGINIVGTPASNLLTVFGIQATTAQRGTVTLATNAQAIAGTDAVNAITSAALKAKLGTQTAHSLAVFEGTASALTALGVAANGQIPIGSGGANPVLANITSTGHTVTITNGPGTINLEVAGGGAIDQINGDTGHINGSTVTIEAGVSTQNCGSSVEFVNSVATSTLNVTDSNSNTIVGKTGGNATLSGTLNSGFGVGTFQSLTNGLANTAVGIDGLANLTSGQLNTAIGYQAGGGAVTGSGNTYVGTDSGSSDGSNNTALGYNAANSLTTTDGDNIIIMNAGTAGDNHIIRIGTQGSGAGQQNKCFIAGIEGVSVSNLNIVTINTATGQLGSQAAANVGTVTQYDVLVGGAAGAIASVGPGSAGQVLQSGGNAANPAYSTATYPATTTINQILYSSSANTVAGLATANQGVLTTGATGIPVITALASNGQLIIGSTAGVPAAATLTPGTGISITNAANSITISATGTSTLNFTAVSSSPYVVAATDDFLGVNSSGGAISVQLPNAPTTGRVYIIKDSTGSAVAHNITVTTVGGVVDIDGATSYVMKTNYESIQVLFDGSAYEVF